jgi:hypothetical protein
MVNKPLKVGFDLDGVLLYNPARIIRLPVVAFKHIFLKKREKKFLVPKNPFARFVWRAMHWSSLFIAPGLDEIERLVKKGKIEAYIVSARYDFLEPDFERWMRRLNKKRIFYETHHNRKNEQPHLFKEKMMKDLGLDVFVEDNYNIVSHLTKKTPTKIFWIYNILDRKIAHPYKFSNLEKAVERIKKLL